MFTGIVEEIGRVKAMSPKGLTISARKALEGTKLGDSVAVNGVCLTVTRLGGSSFSVDVMPETLRRTNLGGLRSGDPVNLERALGLGDRLGGHLVQGHVDATGKLLSFTPQGDATIVAVSAPPSLMPYIVEKGFVAVDGISLTVIERDSSSFKVSLVAYTQQNTILGTKKPGELVNLEVDILAKYVEQLLKRPASRISQEFLVEHGFGV
ncbi:MAG: ribE [Dehalococcoidia bacterium]|nr:ribE [Dehalococcoidia bacterium]